MWSEAEVRDAQLCESGKAGAASFAVVWARDIKGGPAPWFMEPTVFSDVDPKMRIAQEEIFGPVVSIIPCDGLEDAIEIANGIEYGLSSALYTKLALSGLPRFLCR